MLTAAMLATRRNGHNPVTPLFLEHRGRDCESLRLGSLVLEAGGFWKPRSSVQPGPKEHPGFYSFRMLMPWGLLVIGGGERNNTWSLGRALFGLTRQCFLRRAVSDPNIL